ncbi:hypothetical protein OIV83_001978 [Microbotryomycetes sp. JL201]|nr:hypothetical protein OIV83_001978 [Microbotryomycetes sp. JL201]
MSPRYGSRKLLQAYKQCCAGKRLLSSSAGRGHAHSTAPKRTNALLTGAVTACASLALWTYLREPLALETTPQELKNRPASFGTESRKLISGDIVKRHATADDCWVVIDGEVWDVTAFLKDHPGGAQLILEHAGKDVTNLFNMLHATGTFEQVRSQISSVGVLDPATVVDEVGLDDSDVSERRSQLPPPEFVLNLREMEAFALQVLGKDSRAWRYFSSYADDGASYNSAAESFSFLRFLPIVNVPVADVDTSTTLLGNHVPIPVFFCPTGQGRQGHPDGEWNLTRAGSKLGTPQGVSSGSSLSIVEILQERGRLVQQGSEKRTPVWWQLYIQRDRKESERRIREAAQNGSDAIIITVDVTALGKREADARVLASTETKQQAKKDGGLASAGASLLDANLSWDDISWVRKVAPKVPIIVKGIQRPEDVKLAKQYGANAVILSNHGGRQLDGSNPPLATLVRTKELYPELLKDPKFEVYIDGGVRRGTDVLKALCLGAKGVGLGRAMIYAQACYGEEGVLRAMQILQDEIKTGMMLLGAKTVKDLKPSMVEMMPGLVGHRFKD